MMQTRFYPLQSDAVYRRGAVNIHIYIITYFHISSSKQIHFHLLLLLWYAVAHVGKCWRCRSLPRCREMISCKSFDAFPAFVLFFFSPRTIPPEDTWGSLCNLPENVEACITLCGMTSHIGPPRHLFKSNTCYVNVVCAEFYVDIVSVFLMTLPVAPGFAWRPRSTIL